MSFSPDDLLWVKLEGYPWWPAKALGDEYLESHPDLASSPNDMAIVYLGSDAMGFVDRTNSAVVVPFSADDEAKCAECRESSDPTLVTGLEQAIAIANGTLVGGIDAAPAGDDSSSDDDEDADPTDDLLMMGGDASAGAGETDEERRLRRKKEKKDKKDKKKDKKDKDKKKEKKDKKKDKKRRDDGSDDEDEKKTSRRRGEKEGKDKGTSSGRETKRSRGEKSKGARRGAADDSDAEDFIGYGQEEVVAPAISFEKIDIDEATLLILKAKLAEAIECRDATTTRACFSDLSRINVTYDQLISTGIGQTVGQVCDLASNKEGWGAAFTPLQSWAEAIVCYWFSRIPTAQKGRLVDAGEVDRASLASNEDAASLHAEDDRLGDLDEFGLEVERAMNNAPENGGGEGPMSPLGQATQDPIVANELLSRTVASYANLAASSVIISIPELAYQIQEAVEQLPEGRRAEVLNMLSTADHVELRRALLNGSLSVEDFVKDPLRSSLTEEERRALAEKADLEGKAMDITGENERIMKAIANSEVVEK